MEKPVSPSNPILYKDDIYFSGAKFFRKFKDYMVKYENE
ncbi:hypothetical protein MNB_SM-4-1779 [hydrothermal vent metagenome]|uniref:Uncharacterized protein n=1 Tax=hydrothermal vent metagenome TaxID=652676 RepID=A0A1W1C9S4_9ZZZZ